MTKNTGKKLLAGLTLAGVLSAGTAFAAPREAKSSSLIADVLRTVLHQELKPSRRVANIPEPPKPEPEAIKKKLPEAPKVKDIKAPEVKKPEVRKPEIKKPNIPDVKKPDFKKPDVKDIKTPEIKKPEVKTPEIKKPEIKKPDIPEKPDIKRPFEGRK